MEDIKTIHKLNIELDRVIIPLDYNYATTGDLLINIDDNVKENQQLSKSISNDNYSIALHSPIDGTITRIGYFPGLQILSENNTSNKIPGIEICAATPHNEQQSIHNADKKHLKPNLIEILKNNGVIGLGGAGFPSAKKLESAVKHLIINAVECEQPITVDNCLILNYSNEILSGIEILNNYYKPEKITIAIKSTMKDAIDILNSKIQKLNNIDLKIIPNKYPNGYSKSLVKIITNNNIDSNTHSSDLNIICLNIATIYSIYQAYNNQPLIERLVTLTGDINQPGNYLLKIGTPINTILKNFDIDLNKVKNNQYNLIIKSGGDYMGHEIFNSEKSNTLEQYYHLSNLAIDKTTQALDIKYIKTNHGNTLFNKIKKYLNININSNESARPCIKCGLCEDVCPMNLLPQQLYWYSKNDDLTLSSNHHITSCIECGLCDTVCPSNIKLAQKFKYIKSKIKINNYKNQQANLSKLNTNINQRRLQLKEENKYKTSGKLIKSSKSNKKDLLASTLLRAKKKKQQTTPIETK